MASVTIDDVWKRASGNRGSRDADEVPNGTYVTEVIDFRVWKSQSGDYWYKFSLRVTQGEHQGAYLELFRGINERSASFLMEEVEKLTGKTPETLTGWLYNPENNLTGPARVEIVGKYCQVTQTESVSKKNGKVYKNLGIDLVLEQQQPAPAAAEPAGFMPPASTTVGEDDIPF